MSIHRHNHNYQFRGFEVFCNSLSTNATPTGLRFVRSRFSTQIPSLRDSRGFQRLQGFCVKLGAVRKPHLPGLVVKIRSKNEELNASDIYTDRCPLTKIKLPLVVVPDSRDTESDSR